MLLCLVWLGQLNELKKKKAYAKIQDFALPELLEVKNKF